MSTPLNPYGDRVPNQPKYPGRHLRMDAPRWEGLGVIGAAQAGDRTKEVIQWLDWLLYAPGAEPPKRLPQDELIEQLRAASAEAAEAAESEPKDDKREQLEKKAKALAELAALVTGRRDQE